MLHQACPYHIHKNTHSYIVHTLGVPTFKKNFIRFGWVINISNNISWRFQKCKFYRSRTHDVDAQLLPTQPTYRLGYRLCGQSWRIEGVCLGTFVRIEKLSFWESPVKICGVAGTPNVCACLAYPSETLIYFTLRVECCVGMFWM